MAHKDLGSNSLQDSPDEAGAQKHRVGVTPIDYRRGSATAYVAKYVSKNIDCSSHLFILGCRPEVFMMESAAVPS